MEKEGHRTRLSEFLFLVRFRKEPFCAVSLEHIGDRMSAECVLVIPPCSEEYQELFRELIMNIHSSICSTERLQEVFLSKS